MADPTSQPPTGDEHDPIADQRNQWRALIGDDRPLDPLLRRHRERHRRYHTVEHVLAVVRHVTSLSATEPVEDLGAVVAAAWFHDAVYEPRSPANERASARLARSELATLGWTTDRVDAVGVMIEGTAHHTGPGDIGTAVLYDADLAVLGAQPDRYDAYVGQVRSEYSHVGDQEWSNGRATVLQGFLDRERIYATATAHDEWESNARRNLSTELEDLTD